MIPLPVVPVVESSPLKVTQLQVKQWSLEQFAAYAAQWNQLLSRSSADPLFMSWEWQFEWWRCHAELLRAELLLLAAYSDEGELLGLAPLYRRSATHRGGFKAWRIETIGSTWRRAGSVFSEYLNLIVEHDHAEAVLAAFARHLLERRDWSDLLICNARTDSDAARLVRTHLRPCGHVREVDFITAYRLPMAVDLDAYLRSLPASVRRKVWNQRQRLQEPKLVTIKVAEIERLFDTVDRFHGPRWGRSHFKGNARRFHMALARRMAERDALRASLLLEDGQVISALYNFQIGSTEYNLQSGFDMELRSGISPGYLHFGYCIERAAAAGVTTFDFLAGEGKERAYKRDFQTEESPLCTFQLIRSAPLQTLYRLYDWWRERL